MRTAGSAPQRLIAVLLSRFATGYPDGFGGISERQRHYVRTQSYPLAKVLEILKNFFQEVFKQGLGRRPKVLTLCIRWRSKRRQPVQSRLTGLVAGRPECVKRKRLQVFLSTEALCSHLFIPLVKVLKVLRKLFQKFSKQGLGQGPKVLKGFGTESRGLSVPRS